MFKTDTDDTTDKPPQTAAERAKKLSEKHQDAKRRIINRVIAR